MHRSGTRLGSKLYSKSSIWIFWIQVSWSVLRVRAEGSGKGEKSVIAHTSGVLISFSSPPYLFLILGSPFRVDLLSLCLMHEWNERKWQRQKDHTANERRMQRPRLARLVSQLRSQAGLGYWLFRCMFMVSVLLRRQVWAAACLRLGLNLCIHYGYITFAR